MKNILIYPLSKRANSARICPLRLFKLRTVITKSTYQPWHTTTKLEKVRFYIDRLLNFHYKMSTSTHLSVLRELGTLNNNLVTKLIMKLIITPDNAAYLMPQCVTPVKCTTNCGEITFNISLSTCIPHIREWISAISRVRRARPCQVGDGRSASILKTQTDSTCYR